MLRKEVTPKKMENKAIIELLMRIEDILCKAATEIGKVRAELAGQEIRKRR